MPRILIVEDDKDVRETILDYLGYKSMNTLGVEDGIQALQVLEKDQSFDLIMADISMPRMTGLEFLQEYTGKYHELIIPVVMLTAHNESAKIVEALRMGACGFITKPFDVDDMVDRIQNLVQVGKRMREQRGLVLSIGGDLATKYLHLAKMNALFRIKNNRDTKKRAA